MSKEELEKAYRKFDEIFGDILLGSYIADDQGNKKIPSLHECMRVDKISNQYKVLRRQMYDLMDDLIRFADAKGATDVSIQSQKST